MLPLGKEMNSKAFLFMLFAGAMVVSAHAARVGGHSSPFYFAEDDDYAPQPTPKKTTTKGQKKIRPKKPSNPYANLKRVRYLPPGRFEARVTGLLCNACTKAVLEDLKKIKKIKTASFDFEEGVLRFTVTKGKPVRLSKVIRAVRHAGRRVKLGTQLLLVELKATK